MRWYWFLALIILLATLYYPLQAGVEVPLVSDYLRQAGISQGELWQIPTVQEIRATPTVLPQYWDGNSRYSQGSCEYDSDCIVTGCSKEVCAPQETISSCELRYDFPQAFNYTCQCVRRHCGWQ